MARRTNDDGASEGLDLQEEDRLPWLEAVEDYDREPSVSPGKLLGLVLGGLGLLALIVGGIYWLQGRGSGSGDLIAAQEGDYKVPPSESGAKSFDGEGDASYSTSQGAEPSGKIDASKVSETPVIAKADAASAKAGAAGSAGATAQSGAASAKAQAPAAPAGKAAEPKLAGAPAAKAGAPGAMAKAPVAAPAPAAAGSAMIQLGAFGSEATANTAWSGLTKRFSYLAGLSKTVVPAAVGGGTVYRLRVGAGSAEQAGSICSRLRAAGENCIVVR